MAIPTAFAVPDQSALIPAALPVDALGNSLIPELRGRTPTHNESIIISGDTITMASTNVASIWWNWRNQRLFVEFLDGSLYQYLDVPLSIVVKFIETASPGRFVWSYLRVGWPTPSRAQRLRKGNGVRRKPQVVRLVR